jgi:hypothetical protein
MCVVYRQDQGSGEDRQKRPVFVWGDVAAKTIHLKSDCHGANGAVKIIFPQMRSTSAA